MNKWKGERKEGMEGGRERRRDRLRQKSLTARPGLSVPLLPKFHKICPWLHLLWHYFGRIYLRIRYLIQLILYFYWLFVFSYVLFSWMKWLELIRFYSEIRNKKFFLKKNSTGSVGCQITFAPVLRIYDSSSLGLSKYSFYRNHDY